MKKKRRILCEQHTSYKGKEFPTYECIDCLAAWLERFQDKEQLMDALIVEWYMMIGEDKPTSICLATILEIAYRAGKHEGAQNPYC